MQCRAALEGVLFGGLVVGPVGESKLVNVLEKSSLIESAVLRSSLPCVCFWLFDVSCGPSDSAATALVLEEILAVLLLPVGLRRRILWVPRTRRIQNRIADSSYS